ncbi:semaphorin-4A-like isoform X2 [Phycodurus eques]|uniref:semaphorin-4A-like isoform X2 n=1 Tax=Phycodurus eques TaxID=693459 RepID=UPI002ACD3F98|nr:semaphorin-4A-like isoform X2 [Phycodurus eques]
MRPKSSCPKESRRRSADLQPDARDVCCIIEPPRSETGSLKASSPLAVSPLPVFAQSLCASTMAVALVLLLAAVATDAVLPPRAHVSFVFDSPDRPLVRFPLVDVRNCTSLLLSDDRDTLYVGARDAVLSLDVSGGEVITLKRKVSGRRGRQSVPRCPNAACRTPSAGVLASDRLGRGRLPKEREGRRGLRKLCERVAAPERLARVRLRQLRLRPERHLPGRQHSGHDPPAGRPRSLPVQPDPEERRTRRGRRAVHRRRQRLQGRHAAHRAPLQQRRAPGRHSGLVADPAGRCLLLLLLLLLRPRPLRRRSRGCHPHFLFSEADFVGSALDSARRKVLFFFSEPANEFNVEERPQVARVASVCQDDVGGAQILQKKWTSLVKTTLRCLTPFRVLRDVFALAPPEGADAAHTLFYAIFVSQWSLRSESAVCSFRLASLRAAFAGSYRSFDTAAHLWSPLLAKSSYFGQCGLEGAPHANLEEVKRTFLTGGPVAPETGGPLVVSAHLRYSRVAAMSVRGADGRRHQVLFLLTESGLLHKVFLSARGPRLIEEIAVLESGERVTAFVLSTAKGLAFVGSWRAVTAVPVARCSAHATCGRCLLARDPLCGWSQSRKLCARLEREQPKEDKEHLVQLLEGGDVAKECRGEGGTRPVNNVVARANEVVKLPCDKPWESSTLTWTSSRFRVLPPHLFIRSDDGSLNFLASGDTVGTYRCQAEEDGYAETVAGYDVVQSGAPRSVCADCAAGVPAESSSPPTALCERRDSRGRPVGVALVTATCVCFLMSVAILACVRRKSAARHEGPPRAQEGKCEFGVSEPRVELRQLTDTPT